MELEIIKSKIYEVRGQRVMLDMDLAQIIQIEQSCKESTNGVSDLSDDIQFVYSTFFPITFSA